MYEQWHPLGPVGVISAFNFPTAVWAWNAMIAMICGNTVVWKPSSKAAVTALATMKLVWPVLKSNNLPEGILNLVIGDRKCIGETLIHDKRVPLISVTGSVRMGRHVSGAVASRLGKIILELGGNNAIIVAPSADLGLAVRGTVFGSVGTAGQRCTSTRRVMVHESIYKAFCQSLIQVYQQIRIGNPFEDGIHMGPLIDSRAVNSRKYFSATRAATAASPMSISALPERRSEVPSAARRIRGADAKPGPTRGRPICGDRPVSSTGQKNCRWPRELNSAWRKDRMSNSDQYASWQIPDNIFNYVELVSQSDGIGKISGAKLGSEIAIIGAGCAGLCAPMNY
jgi:hypothetical protein